MPKAPHLTFILGGRRSGKSRHAESLIEECPAPWTYIATAQAFDDEMHARIAQHQTRRDARWTTIDAPLEAADALMRVPDGAPVLLDCLTLWLTNVMLGERDVEKECHRLVGVLAKPRGPWVVVSNETGLGIIPDNALARRFGDVAGTLNQQVAAIADSVVLMVAGLPMQLR